MALQYNSNVLLLFGLFSFILSLPLLYCISILSKSNIIQMKMIYRNTTTKHWFLQIHLLDTLDKMLEQTYTQIATKHVWYSSLGYTEFGVGHFTSNVDIWKQISKIFRSRTIWINIGSHFPKYSDIGQIWINIGSDFPKTVVHVSINCRSNIWMKGHKV